MSNIVYLEAKSMRWLHAFFLLTALTVTSGYRFRCWWFCTDQTAIQNDYIEQRDRCREYAQIKLDMMQNNFDDKNRKAQLVTLFSECMGKNGWSVPDGRDGAPKPAATAPAAAAAAAPVAPVLAAPTVVTTANDENRRALSRAAECAFARQAASVSSISAARAKACDLECEQRLRAAPGAPRPAACPPENVAPSGGDENADGEEER